MVSPGIATGARRVSPRRAVTLIVLAELFGTSLWFSANAVADALHLAWGLTTVQLGYLTSAVQLGFISGTLLFALSGLADRFSASRIFALCALTGAVLNGAFAMTAGSLWGALALRFLTGVTLAGVYPVGMKLVVSWAPERAGRVLGWLVGMLTLGTGLPHLVRGSGVAPTWQGVIYSASALAIAAALLVLWLGDGPHHANTRRMQWGRVLETYRLPAFRSAALGYFGHMWELYAFWAMVPLMIAQIAVGQSVNQVYGAAFFVFAAGGLGCVAGGLLSQQLGSARIAIVALTGSALCCLLYPWIQGAPYSVALSLLLAWGLLVVADSPQFSALASQACPKERIGSALALMNSIGFGISIVAIQIAAGMWDAWSARIAWLLLPGPVLGLLAMRRLWRNGS
jgi:MFS family permease